MVLTGSAVTTEDLGKGTFGRVHLNNVELFEGPAPDDDDDDGWTKGRGGYCSVKTNVLDGYWSETTSALDGCCSETTNVSDGCCSDKTNALGGSCSETTNALDGCCKFSGGKGQRVSRQPMLSEARGVRGINEKVFVRELNEKRRSDDI